ncbi:hypothetical protein EIK77_004342 [Talaromyces pinophilus]|nr:hypothetical protein EIK77_004342 [Talaromyces pinophilus]PCG94995.1 Phytanoyl-CoA dioxygenase [Penicillium occitanis (nom. inval.)]PCG95152.1 hypothetical protein PENOC_079120 [Penicillium occitanis (nom. inval.)]
MFDRVKKRLNAMTGNTEYKLTQEQKDHFMKYGYLRVPNCFSPEKAAEWTKDVWTRLGYSPTDKETWTSERIHMPPHRHEPVKTFAPKAWAAICEVVGGEDRVLDAAAMWNDALIVNLGTKEAEGKPWPHPKEIYGWHVDGDFFIHFLDSREQGLLVIPLFNDIVDHAGGTLICPDSIPYIARHLVRGFSKFAFFIPNISQYNHPEGVSPHMVPRGGQLEPEYKDGFYTRIISQCSEFHEMTGKAGDVILLHPLMVHSASVNTLRIPRIITNPPITLKEPFRFDRKDPNDFSLVERKTLRSLGVDRLDDWKIVGEREMVVPERLRAQAAMKEEEIKRLAAS